MDKQSRGKKILIFIATVIEVAIIFSFVYWLMDLIFDDNSTFDWTTLLQGFIFALIYVPVARHTRNKRAKTSTSKKQ